MLPFLIGSPIFLDASLFKLSRRPLGRRLSVSSRRKRSTSIFWPNSAAFASHSALTLTALRPNVGSVGKLNRFEASRKRAAHVAALNFFTLSSGGDDSSANHSSFAGQHQRLPRKLPRPW
jgi:hypothetical protein